MTPFWNWRRLPVAFAAGGNTNHPVPVALGDLLAALDDGLHGSSRGEITAADIAAILDGKEALTPEEEARLAVHRDEDPLAAKYSAQLSTWERATWDYFAALVENERTAAAVLRARLDGREPTQEELRDFYTLRQRGKWATQDRDREQDRLDRIVADVHEELARRYGGDP